MILNNAQKIPCDRLFTCEDETYSESIRTFQGCPTLARTRGGRLFLGWYSGGACEPHMDNYNLIVCSDDNGRTWSKPVVIIPSSKPLQIHALDIQLWTAPNGELHVYWVQNNTEPDDGRELDQNGNQPITRIDGYIFSDMDHSEWRMICKDPDAGRLVFEEPERLDKGFLRCKPLVTRSGRWINFNYDQTDPRYGYSISDDEGRTYRRRYGARKISTPFDEAMAYQKRDGSIRMLARSTIGQLAESISYDDGMTWTEACPSGIVSPSTRFYISRLPSGRILLIANDHPKERTNMTAFLSEDDGVTWKYRKRIDERGSLSYPDADFDGERIYLSYDRERVGANEILFASFTEEDIMRSDRTIEVRIVSKPRP